MDFEEDAENYIYKDWCEVKLTSSIKNSFDGF